MPFDTLTPADDATLHWRQPGALGTALVLVAAGDRTFARLATDAARVGHARAESASGAWTFEQQGFWTPSIVVRRADDGAEVARLDVRSAWTMKHADLAGAEGAIARWEMTSFLKGIVTWQGADGTPLVTFRRGTDEGGVASWFRTQCRVDLTPEGFAHPHRDLLLCLGWFLGASAMEPAI